MYVEWILPIFGASRDASKKKQKKKKPRSNFSPCYSYDGGREGEDERFFSPLLSSDATIYNPKGAIKIFLKASLFLLVCSAISQFFSFFQRLFFFAVVAAARRPPLMSKKRVLFMTEEKETKLKPPTIPIPPQLTNYGYLLVNLRRNMIR